MSEELYKIQIAANFLAIFLGPVTAVVISLWVQSRRDKKSAKQRLFMTLLSERKSIIITYELSKALNTIDVVFADNRTVVDLWHKYYTLLSLPPSEDRNHTWLELLGAMAEDLNYPKLKHTDLDKYYTPQGHVDEKELQGKMQREFLRVLENTAALIVHPKEDDKPCNLLDR